MLHQVGVGALGPVFRTYEPTRDRLIAVKIFRLDITPERAQSLADELTLAADAGLFHPSIVEPIAAGVEGTVAYRAEEYVAAESLDVVMRQYAPPPLEQVLPVVTQLAGAIDFARTAGVGHGALHPRDVFVTTEEARATGFGVVEALERVGLRAPVRRPYSAPERVAGGTWGTPADVFSLAVITFELMTGRRPAGTGAQIGPLEGEHGAALHDVLARALDEQPERRFPSALAFASALEAAARGGGGKVRHPSDVGVITAPLAAGVSGAAGDTPSATLPVRHSVDERLEQPLVPPQQHDQFRPDDPAFDDIAAERESDEAHLAGVPDDDGGAAPGDRLLFDDEHDEAVEDLALGQVADTERFADEFGVAARETAHAPRIDDDAGSGAALHVNAPEPVRGSPRHREVPPAVAAESDPVAPNGVERSRSTMLPIAITLVLALLVGFAAGYGVGSRESRPVAAADPPATAATPDPPEPEGKPFSEQAVNPPAPSAEPPPTVGEAPPPATSRAEPVVPPSPTDKPSGSSAPRPSAGRITVRSTPSGAGVTIDGRWTGRTPLTLERLAFGTHDIRVVQQGYNLAREVITLSEGTPSRTLSFRLQRMTAAERSRPAEPRAPAATTTPASQAFTGTVYVDSRPRGARVLLDGKMVGVTPLQVPDVRIGSHVIRLQLADHRDWTTTTRVAAGQEARVTASLERIQ